MTSFIFFLSLTFFTASFKTHFILFHIFIIGLTLYTFWWTVYCMTCYCKSTVTSYYFFVVLKQNTEVKTLPIAHVTQFHNSRTAMSQTVSHKRGLFSSKDHSIWDLATLKFWNFAWYSPGIFHSPVSTLTLTLRTHTITNVHNT